MLKQIKNFYRVGLTWTSNALEGNSLTMSETKVLIEDGLTVGGKPLRDMFEVLEHAKAYNYMFTLLENKEIKERDILYLHKLFFLIPSKARNLVFARHLRSLAIAQDDKTSLFHCSRNVPKSS